MVTLASMAPFVAPTFSLSPLSSDIMQQIFVILSVTASATIVLYLCYLSGEGSPSACSVNSGAGNTQTNQTTKHLDREIDAAGLASFAIYCYYG